MRFIYFTDIHLCEGFDSRKGLERCLDSMLGHSPELLVCGGDLGVTPEAVDLYAEVTRDVPEPILLSNGNHEMCSGYLPREKAGTAHSSHEISGVHFVILDVVRYFEPTETHPWNWHVLADDRLLAWLEKDLAGLDRRTPVVMACHVPVSTTFPVRTGYSLGMDFPTNEIANAGKVLDLLRPFDHVATLHGHDHENSRHFVDHIEIMTTAAVAGNWWRNGLDSRCGWGREPQGYRVVDVSDNGTISSQYVAYTPEQDEPAEAFKEVKSGRPLVNVYDASPRTKVEVEGVGMLNAIDPYDPSSEGLATHLYELPDGFDHARVSVRVSFENGRVEDLVLDIKELAE
jgi:3',5'-cyclic-AMP phosphodiesterase